MEMTEIQFELLVEKLEVEAFFKMLNIMPPDLKAHWQRFYNEYLADVCNPWCEGPCLEHQREAVALILKEDL